MRVLTRAEATVVWLLISRLDSRSNHPAGPSGIPRRTLQTVRQRVYLRGWIRDRYIPTPTLMGLDRLTFALMEPHSERAGLLVQRWKARPENILLWTSGEAVFGVFISSKRGQNELAAYLTSDASTHDHYLLEVECLRNSIPVYFDFEAVWVRWAGLPRVTDYPRSLQSSWSDPSGSAPTLPSTSQLKGVERLASTFMTEGETSMHPSVISRILGRKAEERYLGCGWVAFRSFLDPISVSRSVTGFPSWCVFVRGNLSPQVRPPDLFQALVGPAAVSPFLFVTDQKRVLFGALSMGPGVSQLEGRAPVLPAVQAYLRDISVSRWPLGTTRIITDHRYDRVLAQRGEADKRGPG
jgi:hypothetical protein